MSVPTNIADPAKPGDAAFDAFLAKPAQVAAAANDGDYGLSAYLWTSNVATAHGLARALKAGTVIINGGPILDVNVPSGGFKQSGVGRQHGREGFEGYLETKSVVVNL